MKAAVFLVFFPGLLLFSCQGQEWDSRLRPLPLHSLSPKNNPDSSEYTSTDTPSTPDSSEYTSTNTPSTPDSSEYTSTDTPSTPDSSEYTSTDTPSTPDSSEYTSTDTPSTPDSSEYTSTDTPSTPDSSEYTSTDTPSTPDSSEYTSANTASTPDSSEYTSTNTPSTPVSSASPPTTGNITTGVKPCHGNPCGRKYATCTNLIDGYICVCPPYNYYDNSSKCVPGKTFFGSLRTNSAYNESLKDTTSQDYKDLHGYVTAFFSKCFMDTDYKETIITKIESIPKISLGWNTRKQGGCVIEVMNTFAEDSPINQTVVKQKVEEAIKKSSMFSNFTETNDCDLSYCDMKTTSCTSEDGGEPPLCTCREGFYQQPFTDRSCKACAPNCTDLDHQYCFHIEGKIPSCECLPNYNNISGTCEVCPLGYSGRDCKDNALLIIIIISCIGGALLLGLFGGIIGLALRSKKNQAAQDKSQLFKNVDNPVYGKSLSTVGKLFPKVKAKTSQNNSQNTYNDEFWSNPYAIDEPNFRSIPPRDYDDDEDSWHEMTFKQNMLGRNFGY